MSGKAIAISADWLAAFERLAKVHGISVEELLQRGEFAPFRQHDFQCMKCGRPFHHFGRYQAPLLRDPADPFAVAHSLRVFAGGLTEIYSSEFEGAGIMCSGCSKMFMEPISRVIGFLHPEEAKAIQELGGTGKRAMDFVSLMMGKGLPAAQQEEQKALPAPKDPPG
jgi:hypothetical protein